MKTQEITAYKTPDGKVYEDFDLAEKHYDDLLGEELDGLLRLSKIVLTRNEEYKLVLGWIGQHDDLKRVINKLYAILNFED